MSHVSLLMKVIIIAVTTGFCLYQLHVLLRPRMMIIRKEEWHEHLSEKETRALDQLRIQLKKNLLLQQLHDQQSQQWQAKLKEQEKIIDQQKKQLQLQATELLKLKLLQSTKQPLAQQQKATQQPPEKQQKPTQQTSQPQQKMGQKPSQQQQTQQMKQPLPLQEVTVHGQKLRLHPSVNVIPSVPSNNSTLSSERCLQLPQYPVRITVCIHDPTADHFVSAKIKAGQLWDNTSVLQMDAILKLNPDMGLVDIGANIGIYTLVAAANDRNVVSVDMQESNIQLLQHSLQKSNLSLQVTLVRNAIYKDHNSKLSYKTFDKNTARSYIVDNAWLPFTVQSVCLDDLIPLVKSKTVYMKIDTENSEHHVLSCGLEFFNQMNVQVVQIKWGQKSVEAANLITNFMKSRNYTASVLVGATYQMWDMKPSNWTSDVFFLKV